MAFLWRSSVFSFHKSGDLNHIEKAVADRMEHLHQGFQHCFSGVHAEPLNRLNGPIMSGVSGQKNGNLTSFYIILHHY